MTNNTQPRPTDDEIMDVELVLAANSDDPRRLPVSSAKTDWDAGTVTLHLSDEGWGEYRELMHPDNLERLND
jgi:hypothetical protein